MAFLKWAGVSSAFISMLHVFIIVWGAPGYRYFGAGERMARLAEQGSPIPTVVTSGLTLVFAVWAAYAFSGASLLKRVPLVRTGLVSIGVLYTLRGALLGPQLVWFLRGYRAEVPPRQLLFSAVALLTGVAYLAGVRSTWDLLSKRGPSVFQEPR
jgi:hypothetical protein